MKDMSKRQVDLKGIQKVSLEILKDVHDFCISNGINYSLAYGTMIGAVRHKGFIPWDDDIDIVMPRPDYERFKKTFKSDKGNVLVTEKDSYLAFARVCDTQKTQAGKSLWPWTKLDVGLWIDIFPLDAINEDKQVFAEKIHRLEPLFDKQLKARNATVHPSKDFGFKQNVKQLIKNIVFSGLNIMQINQSIMEEATKMQWEDSDICSQLVCGSTTKEYYKKAWFEDVVLMPFEDAEFCVATGWHELLTAYYGDYMTLPPVEEREQHTSHTKFYWRES